MNDTREQTYNTLVDVSGEAAKSKALDRAARLYVQLAKDHGKIDELLRTAEQEGSLTAVEIADILDSEPLPVHASVEHTVGEDE